MLSVGLLVQMLVLMTAITKLVVTVLILVSLLAKVSDIFIVIVTSLVLVVVVGEFLVLLNLFVRVIQILGAKL